MANSNCPRAAVLTPYTGGNFGDAAIQDALIANLRTRLPDIQISGISLNSDNFLKRHGTDAFPLCALKIPFYEMYNPWRPEESGEAERSTADKLSSRVSRFLRGGLRRIPGARRIGKKLQFYFANTRQELAHILDGYRFLRSQELLIVSGGGQFDEEWGGAWGHPYSLLKWAILARFARIPFVIASVGVGKVGSATSRFFLGMTLRLARYRSYREVHSQRAAAKWYRGAQKDLVIPDLAFSLPPALMPPSSGIRSRAEGRPIVAVSPIAFARPGNWPLHDQALYDRYRNQMARVLLGLAERGYFLVVTWSSVGDDEHVISEILSCLVEAENRIVRRQLYSPPISSWQDLTAILKDADFLIASRLHSMILGFMTETPTIAISYDPKTDWVMQDLGQTDYLLQIQDFEAGDVVLALDRLAVCRQNVVEQIVHYRDRVSPQLLSQSNTLAGFVCQKHRKSNQHSHG